MMSGVRGALAWRDRAGGLASKPTTHAHPSLGPLGDRMPGSLIMGGGRGLPPGTSPVKLPLSATQEAEPAQGPALRKHRPPGPLGQGPHRRPCRDHGIQSGVRAIPSPTLWTTISRAGLGWGHGELGWGRPGRGVSHGGRWLGPGHVSQLAWNVNSTLRHTWVTLSPSSLSLSPSGSG